MATDQFAKVIRALASFHRTTVDLSSITAPTLVLYGEHEAGFVRRHPPKLAAGIPDAVVREVPDAGHASNLDDPAYFARTMAEFLAGLGSRGGGTGAGGGAGADGSIDPGESARGDEGSDGDPE